MADEGATGGQKIERLEKGNTERTAKHAAVMNEIIDAVNRVLALTVSPQGSGKFVWSDANGVLQLEATEADEDWCEGGPPESGTFIAGWVDGVKQCIDTQECECGVDGGSA